MKRSSRRWTRRTLLLIAALLWTHPAPGWELRPIGGWGGAVNHVQIDGNLAYVGSGQRLLILNIVDPANPVEMGSVGLVNAVLDFEVRDNYAYVAAGPFHPFSVVDVSNPESPVLVWSETAELLDGAHVGNMGRVDIYHNIAYVGGVSTNHTVAYDISNPETPIFLAGVFGRPPEAYNVETVVTSEAVIVGNYFCYGSAGVVGGHGTSFRIYDISIDPTFPPLVGELALAPSNVSDMTLAVEGDYAYLAVGEGSVTTGNRQLYVIDMTNAAAPAVVGVSGQLLGSNSNSDFGRIAVRNGWVYLPSNNGPAFVEVIDATVPTAPTHAGSWPVRHHSISVVIAADHLFQMDSSEGLKIRDMSADPVLPPVVGRLYSPSELGKMTRIDDLLYVADELTGFSIVNVSDPGSPRLLGYYHVPVVAGLNPVGVKGIAVEDDVAYIAVNRSNATCSLDVVDVSDPAEPSLVSDYNTVFGVGAVDAVTLGEGPLGERIAHVGGTGSTYYTIDVTDPNAISQRGVADLPGNRRLRTIALKDNVFGFVGTLDSIDHIVDVSDIDAPVLTGASTTNPGCDTAVEGNIQCVVNSDHYLSPFCGGTLENAGGLYVRDISDPSNPVDLSYVGLSKTVAVGIQNQRAYVVGTPNCEAAGLGSPCNCDTFGGDPSVMAFDLSDPSYPKMLTMAPVGAKNYGQQMSNILVTEPVVFVSSSAGAHEFRASGLTVFELMQPVPGDLDGDGDVDSGDFVLLMDCLGGPEVGTPPLGCPQHLFNRADLDEDNDVDLVDFSLENLFQGDSGACCMPDGTCDEDVWPGVCSGTLGRTFLGPGSTCELGSCPVGGCCLPDGNCMVRTEAGCLYLDGVYLGGGTDCLSSCPTGACCDPDDGGCSVLTEAECIASNGTYQGDDVICMTDPPTCPFGAYHNTINPMTQFAPAGPGMQIADDLTLAGTGARDLVYLDLRVFGNGGGAFNVTVALYDGCPGAGGVAVPGTTFAFNGIPDDGFVYTLIVDPLPVSVTIPDTVWMRATFSTSQAGWIVAEEAELGFTEDFYGLNAPPWNCSQTLGGGTYSGLWANLACQENATRTGSPANQSAAPRTRVIRVDAPAPTKLKPVGNAAVQAPAPRPY